MKIFVTGAGGFIGGHVVDALVAAGHEVTALVRRRRPRAAVRAILGDVAEPASYLTALRGCDAAIHLAADYQLGPRDRAAMYRANVTGTVAMVDAALAAGVPRIVHTSSTAALGASGATVDDPPGDEARRHDGVFRSYYEETKHIAHGLVAARIARGAPISIAIPGGVFGADDRSVLALTLRDVARGKLPLQVATTSRFQLCPVERVADGLVAIASRGRLGESYLLTGVATSMPALITRTATLAGRPAPRTVPRTKLRAVAALADRLRTLGVALPLSGEALAVMDGSQYVYASTKARRELGWDPGDVDAALERYLATVAAG